MSKMYEEGVYNTIFQLFLKMYLTFTCNSEVFTISPFQ